MNIEYRAKETESKKWVYGYYVEQDDTTFCFKEDYDRHQDNTKHYIYFDEMSDWGLPNRHMRADVIPETVGLFTGVTDKYGKRIYVGDIILHILANEKYVVVWVKGRGIRLDRIGQIKCNEFILDDKFCNDYAKVLGNIHDNPEMLDN